MPCCAARPSPSTAKLCQLEKLPSVDRGSPAVFVCNDRGSHLICYVSPAAAALRDVRHIRSLQEGSNPEAALTPRLTPSALQLFA
ncbi:hypothetical protein EYF80_010266 [Liparis tanakae]|uniref:Uncharacterized protein n=1 Tax=Liparis tanakae TaxID=230148 RepID=A0A4Z2IQG1_9TELE|nr:hypothetical protein EYF80_010266 [Liparis tanakae]